VAWLAQQCGHRVVCFVDDDPAKAGRTLNDVLVVSFERLMTAFPNALIALGIGNPVARERVVARVTSHRRAIVSLVHPGVVRSGWVTLGTGVVICAGSIVTTNVVIGDHVQVNVACTISHDVELGSFATLAPGVHLSGAVKVGVRAYLGTGANVINGTAITPLTIGDDAIVGAGACVTQSVDAGLTVVGVPAKPMRP
jgi:sugar O-acyltransferase (sialic acid O-acetyltransferase NeuD family)